MLRALLYRVGPLTATSANRVEVSQGRQRLTADLGFRVAQGRMEQARLTLPGGFEVVEARNGAVALQVYEQQRPDLILLYTERYTGR